MFEDILRRDRWVVLTSLLLVAALAWAYLISMALDMGGMEMTDDLNAMGAMGVVAGQMKPWTLADGILMFVMWEWEIL